MKKRILWFTVCLLLPGILQAEGMRCGQRLVLVGDTKYKLEALCGKPVAQEQFEIVRHHRSRNLHGRFIVSTYPVTVEQYTYDLGPTRFLRIITLEQGVITRIETGERP